ncbi:MAG: ribonuclease HII [Clostridiales bacterium]|jgi:ribonuclease HII|nr:ribonuclease HII [Clostridiales bacterium]
MTISEIKRVLEDAPPGQLPEVWPQFEGDGRAGVKKLVEYYKKWYNKWGQEEARCRGMLAFEARYAARGFVRICGVDEAGAGPLAGPVAAAAVILPEGCIIHGLDDSKKLTAKARGRLYDEILDVAVAWHVAFVDNVEIDEANILQARLRAMERAARGLAPAADFVLVDGVRSPDFGVACAAIQGGDSLSASIAAASVLAKVARDKIMLDYHEIYPQYGFDSHKGYGTARHMAAIEKYGPTPIHRRTFLGWYYD